MRKVIGFMKSYITKEEIADNFKITDIEQNDNGDTLLAVKINYKDTYEHLLTLLKDGDILKWHLEPYGNCYFEFNYIDFTDFSIILQAIEEHHHFHNKSKTVTIQSKSKVIG